MKDVAKHAKVSVATVSNVITGKQYVSDSVKKTVENSIDVLGYNVNLVARGLKSKRTFTVGVLLPDITKAFFPDVLKGIEDAAIKENYQINFLSSDYDFELEKKYVEQLKSSRVDGIIIDSCCKIEEAKEWASTLIGNDGSFPVVSLEQVLNNELISSVGVDNYGLSLLSTKYLLDTGHKKVLYISGPLNTLHSVERKNAYIKALEDSNLDIRNELIYEGDFSASKAYEIMNRVITNNVSFDAILGANDQSAIGALKALKESGYKVPEQVAVMGFDNLYPSTLVEPHITTIDVPRYQMGYDAFKLLKRIIAKPARKPERLLLEANMIIRGSTDITVKSAWNLNGW